MRRLTFAILIVVALTLQATAAPRLEMFRARPDFLVMVVVFLGLYAPSREAIPLGWLLGACADLMTIERFGLLTCSYGLSTMIVASLRDYLFRYRIITQTAVVFVACLLLRSAWMMYSHVLYTARGLLLREWLTDGVIASAYTAALAPFAFHILLGLLGPREIRTPLSSPFGKGGGRGGVSRGWADV